jgi:hypothetical protein
MAISYSTAMLRMCNTGKNSPLVMNEEKKEAFTGDADG